MKKLEEQINRNDLIYESSKYVYDFRKFRTIRYFRDSIFDGKMTISKADIFIFISNLLDVIWNFNNKATIIFIIF